MWVEAPEACRSCRVCEMNEERTRDSAEVSYINQDLSKSRWLDSPLSAFAN